MTRTPLGTLLRHMRNRDVGRHHREGTDRQLLDDFSTRRDEVAFATLIARHGPMVLRVCRRVLGHEQDAEDAFQATFLVLANNLRSIRKRESLADWLHGVAYRTAMKVKRGAARRRNHESRLRSVTPEAVMSPRWDEVQAVLDEEIRGLPEPFRAAFTLCVLEDKSGPQAAAELGCKEGTVSSRLTRARQHLRKRLARRGIQLSVLLATVSVAESTGKAAVRPALVGATVRFGLLVAVGLPAAAVIPSHIAQLATGVTRAMFLTKIKIATAVLLALALVATTACVLAHQTPPVGDRPPGSRNSEVDNQDQKPADPKQPAPVEKETVAYGGRVLGPDGKPVVGAKMYLTAMQGYYREPFPGAVQATTGPEGRFEFAVSKAKFGDRKSVVAVVAANHGVGWEEIPADGRRNELTLRLVNDDVPIMGQIVDLEGKPVPGVTIRVLGISAAPGEDLGPWLEAVQGKKGENLPPRKQDFQWNSIDLSKLALKVTTDAEGRFRLTGIGRNRVVRVQIDGSAIASQQLHVLTRSGKTMEVTDYKGQPKPTTYYGADFRHVAAPTKPIVGVVRDKDTKKPLVGVTVESNMLANDPVPGRNIVQTTTDAEGRYRLTGLPKGDGNKIRLVPRDDQPYVSVHAGVQDSAGLDPVTVDFELKRGVWIEGKLTDKATGKPVQGTVDYFALHDNPNLRDHPGFDGTIPPHWGVAAKEDGSFRVVGLPGQGLIAVFYDNEHLLVPDRDDEYGTKESELYTSPRQLGLLINYTALARINVGKGAESVKCNVTLDPGRTFTGTVLGPDGKPLTGARSFGLTERGWSYEAMKTADFTVRAFNPQRARDVLFQHREKCLVGVAAPPKENGGSVTVRMEPGAAVTGRLVDADGKPRVGIELHVWFRHKEKAIYFDGSDYFPEPVKTDREGRFRIEGLLPGYMFRISDGKGELNFLATASGREKDLSDVNLKGKEE